MLEKARSKTDVTVTPLGLVIHPEHHFVAASPDGLVTEVSSGETGLIEIKNLLHNKCNLLPDVAKSSSFFLKIVNGDISTQPQILFPVSRTSEYCGEA